MPAVRPEEVGISYGDPAGGITAAVGILAALVARCRTGKGQHIDVSLWEATTALVAEVWMEFVMNGARPSAAATATRRFAAWLLPRRR